MNSSEFYDTLVRPPLAPPSIVFPIVWGVLYVLMTIAMILYLKQNPDDGTAFWLYVVNLVLNAMWPLFFFALQQIDVALFILLEMGILFVSALSGMAVVCTLPELFYYTFKLKKESGIP